MDIDEKITNKLPDNNNDDENIENCDSEDSDADEKNNKNEKTDDTSEGETKPKKSQRISDNVKIAALTCLSFSIVCIAIIAEKDEPIEKYFTYENSSYYVESASESLETDDSSDSIEITYIFPADVNFVSFDQLCQIPGIGEVTAQSIIDYRQAVGVITDLEQLCEINGIGEKTFSVLEEYLYVDESLMIESNSKVETDSNVKSEFQTESSSKYQFPADVNFVSFDQLCQIPGIGEVTAQSIIDYRQAVGVITDLNQLSEINGIGEKTIALLTEYLYVDESQYSPYVKEEPVQDQPIIVENPQPETQAPEQTTTQTEPEEQPLERTFVNINQASADEISQGLLISPEIAEEIVSLRNQIGTYSSIYELLLIDGLSEEDILEFVDFVILE